MCEEREAFENYGREYEKKKWLTVDIVVYK